MLLPINATLEERERAAYISGDTESAALRAAADDVPQDYDLLKQFFELCAEGVGLSPTVTPMNAVLVSDAMRELFRKRVARRVPGARRA